MATGLKTKLYKGTGTSLDNAVFTAEDAIANLTSIGEQKSTVDEVETTDLDCVDGYKTFEAGMSDNGSIAIAGNITAENYAKLKALTVRNENGDYPVAPFAIYHPTVEDINGKFMAWLSDCGRGELTPGGLVTFSATLRISGKIADFSGVSTSEY